MTRLHYAAWALYVHDGRAVGETLRFLDDGYHFLTYPFPVYRFTERVTD